MVDCMKVLELASRNDAFRRSGFGITMTAGIQNLPDIDGLMAVIRDYDSILVPKNCTTALEGK
jgi:hypothetical protein